MRLSKMFKFWSCRASGGEIFLAFYYGFEYGAITPELVMKSAQMHKIKYQWDISGIGAILGGEYTDKSRETNH